MITVVDYGMGNLGSITNMLERLNIPVRRTGDAQMIAEADRLILPGVGSFDSGMKAIGAKGLREALDRAALVRKIPVLGICLGMQLLGNGSEEGEEPGLGWISATAMRLTPKPEADGFLAKVPQMGWNYVSAHPHPLLTDFDEQTKFYFVHSYSMACDDPANVIASTWYGGGPVTAGIARGNIAGMQFHPEKSHRYGMRLLRNFSNWIPDVPESDGAR